MMYLRHATSQSIMIGPFVSSDGAALTTLTISPAAIRLSKNGESFAGKNLTASNAIHNENGYYSTWLNNTDTGSLGRLLLACSVATAMPVWHEYTVQGGNVYDWTIAGTSALYQMQDASMLGVDVRSITAIADRSPINALRTMRNRITTSGGIMTVYKEDDVSSAWAAALTQNASASLIVEVDPG